MKNLLKTLAVTLIALTLVLAVGCDKSEYSYWGVTRHETQSKDVLTYSVVLKMNKNDNENVKEIWVNVDNLGEEEVEITHVFGSSDSSLQTYRATTKISKAKAADADGWVRLVLTNDNGYSQNYFRISITQTMHVNEIVLVDINGKVIPTTIAKYSEKVTENVGNTYSLEEYEAKIEEESLENTALNLIDEQSKFVLETVRSLYDAANPVESDSASSSK